LLKSKVDAASIRCIRDITVTVLKSQIAIPFFLKRRSPFFGVAISLNIVSHYIILYSRSEIFQKTQILKSITYVYIRGITLPKKAVKEKKSEGFAFRVKIGEYEVEIKGTHEEVTKTLKDLPNIVTNIHKAFENVKPKTVATLTVKTEPAAKAKETPKAPAQTYPKITGVINCEEAILGLLETDWGKWRPRTMEELKDAMKASKITYTKRTLERTLNKLADKGMVRRWSTNTGFVYILAEKKPSGSGGEAS
jgi:hypothetical protein